MMPFEGVAPWNGAVDTSQGMMPYRGPESVLLADRKPCLAVLVPDTAEARRLQPGDALAFHEPPTSAGVAGLPEM